MKREVIQKAEERPKRQGPNLTGIPAQMKMDFERRSGLSFDDVRVHYNSDKPARIGALAYTQGTQVYMGPGQNRHLGHELVHVVQQKQGVVKPTGTKNNLWVNEEARLEEQASRAFVQKYQPDQRGTRYPVVQCVYPVTIIAKRRFIDIFNTNWTIQRTYGIFHAANGATTHDQFMDALGRIYVLNNPRRILDCFLICGLPNRLAQRMSHAADSVQGLILFSNHYVQFNNNRGIDRGQIDPRNISARQAHLNLLQQALLQYALPVVRRAESNGRNARGGIPAAVRNVPALAFPGQAFNASMLESINEGMMRFHTLTSLPRRNRRRLANIAAHPIPQAIDIWHGGIGATTDIDIQPRRGTQSYGLAAGPSQVVHENGHLLENSLGVDDFANLHRFLLMRTNQAGEGQRPTGWGDSPTGGTGYDAELPQMSFQNFVSRWLTSDHSLLRFGLFNAGNYLLSLMTPDRSRGQRFIDDFFLQESNSMTTSYATQINGQNVPMVQQNFSTEFVSTTAELLATERGARTLFSADPTRAAMFFYVANRSLFNRLEREFQNLQAAHPPLAVISLRNFLHII